jgi:hypothetical protein
VTASARTREAELPKFDEIGIRKAEAEARIRAARATRAEHRAAMEPDRQRMALRERETRRVLAIVLALFAMAFLTGVLLLAPWVIPSTGIAAVLAYLWRGTRS